MVLPVLRELVRCYQAFERYSLAHMRTLGLTMPQFDIIATLGNTAGMTFKQLGEKTLITKGTLTGVVDRLVAMGEVERVGVPGDRRSMLVRLTRQGEQTFERVFEPHLAHLAPVFESLPASHRPHVIAGLQHLRAAFDGDTVERLRAAAIGAPAAPTLTKPRRSRQ